MKIISWNLNGIRSAFKNGFLSWIESNRPDIVCFQEIRATQNQIEQIIPSVNNYHLYWNSAKRLGYSGTGLFLKNKPLDVSYSIGESIFDDEGRTIIVEYTDFILINSYVPNGTNRLDFKLNYIDKLIEKCLEYRKKNKEIILCTDFNIAHNEIDLSHSKENRKRSGFLDIERECFEKFLNIGFIDTYRCLNAQTREYSWLSYRARKIGGNFGWRFRFDYIFVTENLIRHVKRANILMDVYYSDHCPVEIEF